MSNAFKDWTPEMVARHNERLAEKSIEKWQLPTVNSLPEFFGQHKELTTNLVVQHSTDEKKLNKLERAWLRELKLLSYPWIGVQCITLKLADDTRYTCDFMVVDANGQLVAYETKGFFRDDAKVKIKVAARLYRFIRFVLVTRKKGVWNEQPINP